MILRIQKKITYILKKGINTMKFIIQSLLLFSIFFSCTNINKKYSIDEFLSSSQIDPMSKYVHSNGKFFSFDNSSIIASVNKTGVYNAFSFNIKTKHMKSITDMNKNSVFVKTFFPDDNRIIYQSDAGGNELDHVYVIDEEKNIKDLTPGVNLKSSFFDWSDDGNYFYIMSNERDPRYFDLYRYNSNDYQREIIFKNDEGYSIDAISGDGVLIGISKTYSRYHSDIFIFNTESKKYKSINKTKEDVSQAIQYFSKDAKRVYLLTDQDSEFQYLAEYNINNETLATVYKTDWDIKYSFESPLGNYRVVAINKDSKRTLNIFDVNKKQYIDIPQKDNLIIWGAHFSSDDKQIVFYAETGRSPLDIYHWNLENNNQNRLTRNLNKNISEEDLVSGLVVKFNSFDDIEIPGVLYLPKNKSKNKKVPAMIWVHGGPGGQSMVGYRDDIQFLVNHGYAIYAINNRGSSGYGKTFQMLDDRKHGKGDLDDCVSSKKMLIETGYIDPDRIGIIGGSYGGYMVLAGLAFRPDSFKLGVDIFGVSNWVRTLQSIPPWWESAKRSLEIELGDFGDTEYLRSISPLFHANKINKPLLVLQGANDPRVLKIESDEIVSSVKKNNVPVDYIIFEDEGHGFEKSKNKKIGYTAILSFLEKHL